MSAGAAAVNKSIAIITDDPGWHGRQLRESFQSLQYEAQFIRLQDCHFNVTKNHVQRLQLGDLRHPPCGVFVRGIPGGSLEQVVFYLDVLHALEAMNIPVMNNVRSIERSVDKGMTSFLLSLHDIPTPKSFISSDLHYIRYRLREGISAGSWYVIKPIFGSQGKGLQLIRSMQDLVDYRLLHGVMYVQEFIASGEKVCSDFRVFVINDQVTASMRRTGVGWISNVAQGAQVEAIELGEEINSLAITAARVIGMEYAGIDMIQDRQGNFWITEVNSVPAWKGLQQTTSISIADAIARDFVRRLS